MIIKYKDVMIAMKYVKGFIAAYFYYLTLVAILHLRHFGLNKIVFVLIIHASFGVFIVLLGALIIESINQANAPKKRMIIFAGFIYGVSFPVLFSGGVDLDYPILIGSGLFSCLGFLIYSHFRKIKWSSDN